MLSANDFYAPEIMAFGPLIDEAHRVLQELPQVKGHASLPKGEGWILARTVMTRIGSGNGFWIGAKNSTVEFRFRQDTIHSVGLFYSMVRHVRNFLAFSAECPVPFAYIVLSGGGGLFTSDYMVPFPSFETYPMRYHLVGVPEDQARAFYAKIEASFGETKELFERYPPDGHSSLGDAISLAGMATWSEEPDEQFFSAVKAIDIIANLDWREALSSGNLDDYEAATGQPIDPSNKDTCPSLGAILTVTLKRRGKFVDSRKVRTYNELRGALAHGSLSLERMEEVLTERPTILRLSRAVVRSAL